ncbi:hypothetical protein EDD85DRAFT_806736, partial [Armillaria nabsnona]
MFASIYHQSTSLFSHILSVSVHVTTFAYLGALSDDQKRNNDTNKDGFTHICCAHPSKIYQVLEKEENRLRRAHYRICVVFSSPAFLIGITSPALYGLAAGSRLDLTCKVGTPTKVFAGSQLSRFLQRSDDRKWAYILELDLIKIHVLT